MKNGKLRIKSKELWRKVSPLIYNVSPELASKALYTLSTRKILNIKNPNTFNEKLMWLKLNWQHPLVAKCADKYEVREYVKECGYENILTELYGVYENPDEIMWNELPRKFAMKCTHGCGFNIICDDKENLDKNKSIENLEKWMKTRYVFEAIEVQYDKMKPRIICEEYIETEAGVLPNDYKIYCFNGEPKLTLVCTERSNDVKLDFLDLDWNTIDIGEKGWGSGKIPEKPKCYEEMLEICKVLSKPFPFVRIDFYDYNGRPILGEMTFTPSGCAARYYNDKGQKLLGDMIKLPEKYIDIK